jgi:hypothetical protein
MLAAVVEVMTAEVSLHPWIKGVLVQKFMIKQVAMKVGIWQRFCLGYKTSYQVFELNMKAT